MKLHPWKGTVPFELTRSWTKQVLEGAEKERLISQAG